MEYVTLVNTDDEDIGEMEKIQAHELGLLHRAFSVFIFNERGELLLQRRNKSKYHSGGLWTNSCCGHPRPGEDVKTAAMRRLNEEMGFQCELTFKQTFLYKTTFENGITEHELDHVFTGIWQGTINPDKEEVDDFNWLSLSVIKQEIRKNPEQFTFWFKEIMKLF